MNTNPKDELEAAQWHLDQAIKALLQFGDALHLGKLGAARYEIAETLIRMNREVDANAQASRVS